ncbi:MAG TPA: antibiotic biosynthesis monooxygenase [Mycobacteriales bacterium]|nr:antibiotic biosynthesis monooxygenase [Mycobacteriales bacterium]
MAGELVTVFRNRVREDAWEEYEPLAARMAELAEGMPGFVERKTFTADDGERVTLVTFVTREQQRAWRDHPEHRAAQRVGVDRIYSDYRIQVCVLEDERRFTRPS